MPTVSVVVPLYNKAPYVRRALDSIANQTFGDFEAIVVDDGSTDDGADIAAAFGDSRFRLLRQQNAGPGAARNRGLEEAKTGLIAFLDADDEWMPDYLRFALEGLRRHPDAATFTCGYVLSPGERAVDAMWRRRGLQDGVQRVEAGTPVELLVHRLAFMTPPTTLSRAAVLQRHGGFYARNRCRYGEDAFLWLRVLLNEAAVFDLAPHVRIHTDASSLSGNLSAARPVEPFLENPSEIEEDCPQALRPLLARFLALRAFKTACVLGYWGKWREARDLRQRFRVDGDRRLPYYWPSLICATPAGAAAGAIARRLSPGHTG
jgi:glycosyltransferase involved in cell wall biosynthesis